MLRQIQNGQTEAWEIDKLLIFKHVSCRKCSYLLISAHFTVGTGSASQAKGGARGNALRPNFLIPPIIDLLDEILTCYRTMI